MTLPLTYQSHTGVKIQNTLLSKQMSFDRLLHDSEPQFFLSVRVFILSFPVAMSRKSKMRYKYFSEKLYLLIANLPTTIPRKHPRKISLGALRKVVKWGKKSMVEKELHRMEKQKFHPMFWVEKKWKVAIIGFFFSY